MSAASRGERRPGPIGEAFGELWREGRAPEALAFAALASQVRTLAGECFPQRLVGPKFRACGIHAGTIAGIVDELTARGLVRRVGEWEASRFYVARAFAREIVSGRRAELRQRLRVLPGGRRDGSPDRDDHAGER